jgi:hypothetical protein
MEKIIKHIIIENQSLLITDKNRFFIAENRYEKEFTINIKGDSIYYTDEYKTFPMRYYNLLSNIKLLTEADKVNYLKYIL